jgi:hypothetical protein
MAKAQAFAQEKGLDAKMDALAHDAGAALNAAKNRAEKLTGKDLDGDGKIGE